MKQAQAKRKRAARVDNEIRALAALTASTPFPEIDARWVEYRTRIERAVADTMGVAIAKSVRWDPESQFFWFEAEAEAMVGDLQVTARRSFAFSPVRGLLREWERVSEQLREFRAACAASIAQANAMVLAAKEKAEQEEALYLALSEEDQAKMRRPLGLATMWETPECETLECETCMGYGHINDETGRPSNDKRDRKCLDCNGTGQGTPRTPTTTKMPRNASASKAARR